ncbi:MAG: response regulator [Archangium sp.]|nr:response regulator [Archangium sp.]MDP3151630.1 response regulator [Archangium sp.]MDP3569165.1 response regulator [Archangium sp.]
MTIDKRSVLVVDDDPEIRKLLVTALDRMGFTVSQAADGKTAMKRLDERRPSLLCIDLMLPESSGYDVCEHVKKTPTLNGLPILMVSARTMPEDRAQAEELGVRVYLSKPFTQTELKTAVAQALEGNSP